jgi:hypothetical protein
MMQLHLPAAIQSFVLSSVQGGGGVVALAGGSAAASKGGIFGELLQAGYAAFGTALHDALYLSAVLLGAATLLALFTLRAAASPAPSGEGGD